MVAIIIPCLNNSWYTKLAVESIRTLSDGHEIRFIFINNGSRDDTDQFLSTLANQHTVITNSENLGVTHAWNQGLQAALDLNAEVIALMNNDIIVGPGWLDAAVNSLRANPKEFYFANSSIPYSGNREAFNQEVRRQLPDLAGKKSSGKCGWSFYFTLQAVKDFFPIPEIFKIWYNDDYIYYRLCDLGYTPQVLHDSVVYHFGSKTLQQDMNKYGAMIDADRKAFLDYAKDHLPSAAIRVQIGY